jgi:hypothetical protein
MVQLLGSFLSLHYRLDDLRRCVEMGRLFTARASDDSLVTSCMEVFDSTKVIDSTKAIDNTKANVELKVSTQLSCTLQRIVALVIVQKTQQQQ